MSTEHTTAAPVAVDPIVTAVVASRLTAIGERMSVVIERSAHSPILVEARDFSLGIYDRSGQLIEQPESIIPLLGFAATPAMQYIAEYFGDDVSEGDVVLHNDPYTGGNQMSDWKIAKPVFHEGEHFAWVVINAHQADVGGSVAGSYNPNATDLWQEALRITPVKLADAGRLRRDVWDMIFGNVRLAIVADDVQAMIGACNVGEQELQAVVERYGLPVYRQVTASLLDAAEASARAMIERIPDGSYAAEFPVYNDAVRPDSEMMIRVTVRVDGEHITFDFTGTDPQTPGYVNAPIAVTVCSVMIAFFMLAEGGMPHNDGVMRCIDVIAPEGSMVNPRFPAASGFGNHLSDQICSVIMLAMAEALPRRVTAGWDPVLGVIVNGWHTKKDRPYSDILILTSKGGGGGTYGADGYDHIGIIGCAGVVASQDPEMFELTNPHRVHKWEYLPDSGGAGQWRGGLGVETIFEYLDGDIQASVFGDGDTPRSAAPGVLGGRSGCPNSMELTYPDGRRYRPSNKELIRGIPAGTQHHHVGGGGGGYGDPYARPVARVEEDVLYGYVSVEAARELYGVVIDERTGRADEERTTALRGDRSERS